MSACHCPLALLERPVRSRTRPGRLAAIDAFLGPMPPGSTIIDFGFGTAPVTSLEWASHLGPTVTVIAVERDLAHIESARTLNSPLTLVCGGFETLATLGPVSAVRAMNVLRAYPLEHIGQAHRALAAPLAQQGLLIEGSTDTEGCVTTAHVFRRVGSALTHEGLLFHTTFTRGAGPWLFRDSLPRDLRRSVAPGTRIFEFLTHWHRCFEATKGSPTERFAESGHQLPGVSLWAPGGLFWRTGNPATTTPPPAAGSEATPVM